MAQSTKRSLSLVCTPCGVGAMHLYLVLLASYMSLPACHSVPVSDSEPATVDGGAAVGGGGGGGEGGAHDEVPATGLLFFQDHAPTEVMRVRAGETFVLDCEAGGSPSPTVHFLRNGHRIIQVTNDSHNLCYPFFYLISSLFGRF